MRAFLPGILTMPALITFGCADDGSHHHPEAYVHLEEEENGYPDGEYCAQVEYYYPKTGTRSTYTLKVEIEDHRLTTIYWPNGGWLDESHFEPPDISGGYTTFESDAGAEYTVKILGKSCE